MQVQQIMTKDIFALKEDSKIFKASEIMTFKNIRHIPVIDSKGKLVGIVTHRDLLSSLSRKLMPLQVREIMTRDATSITPETHVSRATEIMLSNKFGCLPIVDSKGILIGIITETDLLKELFRLSTLVEVKR